MRDRAKRRRGGYDWPLMLRRLARPFHPRAQPWLTRQSYLHELRAAATLPVSLALMEGAVIGVLAKKAFGIPDLLLAVIAASPMFANITSFAWERVARGRRKVPVIVGLQVGLLACVAGVGLLPTPGVRVLAEAGPGGTQTWLGGQVGLVVLMVLARCLWAGIVTVRSTLWRMNYPRHVRGRVVAKLDLITLAYIMLVPLAGYSLLDSNPRLFRVVYPLSAGVGLLGVWSYSRIRLRGQRSLLRYERSGHRLPAARSLSRRHGAEATAAGPPPRLMTGLGVLRSDPLYRRYMLWQFMGGIGNIMGEVVAVLVIADLTRGLWAEYSISIALLSVIPAAVGLLTMPAWARFLDRAHIAHFRSRQGLAWVGTQTTTWVALMCVIWTGSATLGLTLLLVPRLLQGVMQGGGRLAWNLGHNDFAPDHLVPVYMSIHQTLTGIRGIVGPFTAVVLYSGWASAPLWLRPHLEYLTGPFTGIGYSVFLLTAALALIAEIGFTSLHRSVARQQTGVSG